LGDILRRFAGGMTHKKFIKALGKQKLLLSLIRTIFSRHYPSIYI